MNSITAVSAQSLSAIGSQPRLVKAAHEFEAQMMKELLKPMAGGSGLGGDEPDAGSGGPWQILQRKRLASP